MDENDLRLEDWKMTKDRIKHFDDMVMKTRVQGLPIATAIQAIAFASLASVGKIQTTILDLSVFSLIIIASLIYLVPVLLLDILHLILLSKAVKHAKNIEENFFKETISITRILSSRKLTALHVAGGIGIYAVVFGAGFYFLYVAPQILPAIK